MGIEMLRGVYPERSEGLSMTIKEWLYLVGANSKMGSINERLDRGSSMNGTGNNDKL